MASTEEMPTVHSDSDDQAVQVVQVELQELLARSEMSPTDLQVCDWKICKATWLLCAKISTDADSCRRSWKRAMQSTGI